MVTYYKGLVTPFTTIADVIHPTKAHDTDAGWDLYVPRDLDDGGFAMFAQSDRGEGGLGSTGI